MGDDEEATEERLRDLWISPAMPDPQNRFAADVYTDYSAFLSKIPSFLAPFVPLRSDPPIR